MSMYVRHPRSRSRTTLGSRLTKIERVAEDVVRSEQSATTLENARADYRKEHSHAFAHAALLHALIQASLPVFVYGLDVMLLGSVLRLGAELAWGSSALAALVARLAAPAVVIFIELALGMKRESVRAAGGQAEIWTALALAVSVGVAAAVAAQVQAAQLALPWPVVLLILVVLCLFALAAHITLVFSVEGVLDGLSIIHAHSHVSEAGRNIESLRAGARRGRAAITPAIREYVAAADEHVERFGGGPAMADPVPPILHPFFEAAGYRMDGGAGGSGTTPSVPPAPPPPSQPADSDQSEVPEHLRSVRRGVPSTNGNGPASDQFLQGFLDARIQDLDDEIRR